MRKILIAALLSSFCHGTLYSQVDSVIHNYFDTIGGMSAWRKIQSVKTETEVVQNLKSYDLPEGKMTALDGLEPTSSSIHQEGTLV